VNEEVFRQQLQLAGVLAQCGYVIRDSLDARGRHPPPNAAKQSRPSIMGEIAQCAGAQQLDDVGKRLVLVVLARDGRAAGRDIGMMGVADQRLRDLHHRQYEVDRAGRDRVARHPVVGSLFRILGDDQAASVADGLEPDAAVGAGARQDHRDGALAILLRQRVQEIIERQPRTVRRLRPRQPQQAVMHREISLRRNDVDMVALDRHAVGYLQYGHRRMQAEQIDHHAGVRRFEMRNQHKGDPGIRGQRLEQFPESFKPAGGGTDPDHRKSRPCILACCAARSAPRTGAPVRVRSSLGDGPITAAAGQRGNDSPHRLPSENQGYTNSFSLYLLRQCGLGESRQYQIASGR